MNLPAKTVPIVVLGLLLSALSATAARRVHVAPGASRIGYVSIQRLLKESASGQADSARLELTRQERLKEVRARQQAVEATRLELARVRSGADAAAVVRLSRQEQEQMKDLERVSGEAQQVLQALQRDLQREARTRVHTVVDEVAKRHSVQMVLNEDTGVVWASRGSDLTDEVLSKLNAGTPKDARPESSGRD